MDLWELSVQEMSESLKKKEISCEELLHSVYERTTQVDSQVNAFITMVEKEQVIKNAVNCKNAPESNLKGIPYALKDNICTSGVKTTCASVMLKDFVPSYDATVHRKLKEQDAVLVGKLNMDEFAMGTSTELSAFKTTRNPWSLDRVPGGSSGGCAAAVASGEIPFAIGTDTGGSIRQPAAYCGVVGLKPTYGRVSRWGIIPLASSLDQVGIISRNVGDSALVLNSVAGHDQLDSTSARNDCPDYRSFLNSNIKGMKIGVPKEYLQLGIDQQIRDHFDKALALYEQLGARIEEVSLPHSEYALAAYHIICPAEASTNLACLDGIRFGYRDIESDNVFDLYTNSRTHGFGNETKRRIMLGTYALSAGFYDAYYLKALKVRRLILDDFIKVFASFDVIAAPTTPTTAFKIGEQVGDPLTLYMNDILTVPVNMAGLPGITVPCGFAEGLPVGLQLIAKPFEEGTLISFADALERNTDYHTRRPHLEVK